MSKRAVEQFSKYQETNLFLRGMMPLIGYQTDCVYYDRKERVAGESKYPLKKMLALAFNGISSFSVKPISMILGAGMIIVALSLLAAIYALISYCTGHVVPGWTSLILCHLVPGWYSVNGHRTGGSSISARFTLR